MKSIVLKEAGSVENLEYVELAKPTINEGEVLIK
jgi:NADPH:quinone reductase-like Zn-dependent oxidoreductase